MIDTNDVLLCTNDCRRLVVADMLYGTTLSVKIMMYVTLNNIVQTKLDERDQLTLLSIVKSKLVEHSRLNLITELDFFCLSRDLIVPDDYPLMTDIVEKGDKSYATH